MGHRPDCFECAVGCRNAYGCAAALIGGAQQTAVHSRQIEWNAKPAANLIAGTNRPNPDLGNFDYSLAP
jgi:hypothetical protein